MKKIILSIIVASLALFAGKLHINFNDGTPSVELDFTYLRNIEIVQGATPEDMVLIPGGTYLMGDYFDEGWIDELETHEVILSSFYMGKYLVTQKEWTDYMPASNYEYGQGDNYPAYDVSWYATVKYCNLRSISEGLTPVYIIDGSTDPADWGAVPTSINDTWNAAICNWDANGYRLPSESEWEYAARGGIHYTDYYRYSGCHETDDLTDYAWYNANNSPFGNKPVGTKLPNQLGLYDMSGSLFEWCWDWYLSTYYDECYDLGAVTNPYGPSTGSVRVMRGGTWQSEAYDCRVSRRDFHSPRHSYGSFGFRIVRTSLQ